MEKAELISKACNTTVKKMFKKGQKTQHGENRREGNKRKKEE